MTIRRFRSVVVVRYVRLTSLPLYVEHCVCIDLYVQMNDVKGIEWCDLLIQTLLVERRILRLFVTMC